MRPAFVSVTYGAGGTTQDRTVRVTGRIADETSLTPLAHLTCVGTSAAPGAPGRGVLRRVGRAQHPRPARRPAGQRRAAQWTPHPEGLDHADQLVALIRRLGDFTIGVAAFPDVHPDSPDLDHDVEVLVRKADAGASFAITQMVFDADTYLRLRDRVAARRDLPITPGLMPVTNLRQIHRMSELMGTPLPPAVVARLEAVKDDPAAVRSVGVADRDRARAADARRGCARHPLHHDEPVDGHARGASRTSRSDGASAVRGPSSGVSGRRPS